MERLYGTLPPERFHALEAYRSRERFCGTPVRYASSGTLPRPTEAYRTTVRLRTLLSRTVTLRSVPFLIRESKRPTCFPERFERFRKRPSVRVLDGGSRTLVLFLDAALRRLRGAFRRRGVATPAAAAGSTAAPRSPPVSTSTYRSAGAPRSPRGRGANGHLICAGAVGARYSACPRPPPEAQSRAA